MIDLTSIEIKAAREEFDSYVRMYKSKVTIFQPYSGLPTSNIITLRKKKERKRNASYISACIEYVLQTEMKCFPLEYHSCSASVPKHL